MSYSLDLYFEPSLPPERVVGYFAERPNFSVEDKGIFYWNEDTQVDFSVKLQTDRSFLSREVVVSAEFEINYCRPSYFGIEAEREVGDFVATFRPRIEDDQMRGMGEGPYSREEFLSGWNFGNLFCLGRALSSDPDFPAATMPADALRAAWEWNYHLAKEKLACPGFMPRIMFSDVEGRPSRVAIWPQGMPVSLPRVDHVLIGRLVANEKRFGIATWSEILEVARNAGFDTTKPRLDLHYRVTPVPISAWVENIALIDLDAAGRLDPAKVIDDELVAAARAR